MKFSNIVFFIFLFKANIAQTQIKFTDTIQFDSSYGSIQLYGSAQEFFLLRSNSSDSVIQSEDIPNRVLIVRVTLGKYDINRTVLSMIIKCKDSSYSYSISNIYAYYKGWTFPSGHHCMTLECQNNFDEWMKFWDDELRKLLYSFKQNMIEND